MNGSLLILFRKGVVIFFLKNIIFLIIRKLFNKKKSFNIGFLG